MGRNGPFPDELAERQRSFSTSMLVLLPSSRFTQPSKPHEAPDIARLHLLCHGDSLLRALLATCHECQGSPTALGAPRNQATSLPRPCQRLFASRKIPPPVATTASCPPSGPLRTTLSSSTRSSASSTACRPARHSQYRTAATTTSRPR
jgi:hypothetical protein